MYDIMDKQVGLSQQTLDFVKQSYAENQTRQQAIDALNQRIGESQLQDAAINRQRSQEQYDFYKQNGRPVVEQALNDAKTWDSQSAIDRARGRANADVQNSFAQAEQQQARTLSRYGVMPNASRLATINSQLMAQKAAAQAGAMTNAEETRRTQGAAMRQQASNIAQGMPAQAIQFGNAALSGQQAAFGNTIAANNAQLQAQQEATSGFGTAGNMLGGAASTGQGIFNGQAGVWGNQVKQVNAENAGTGDLVGTAATLALLMKDGGNVGEAEDRVAAIDRHGMVQGPGTGTSDSVPAVVQETGRPLRVSRGEVIVPADVVRKLGTQYFDKLIEKHHGPAALQRRYSRG
jgi:hypothetical protein